MRNSSVVLHIFFLTVVVAGFAACAPKPMIYTPNPAMVPAPNAKYRAAVAYVANESKLSNSSQIPGGDFRGNNVNCTTAAGDGYMDLTVSPKQLTEMLVQDLGASGLFTAVDYEGAGGPADILLKTTIKEADPPMVTHDGCYWTFDVQATKGDQNIFSHVYREHWGHTRIRSLRMKDHMDEYAGHWRDWMRELRSDLAKALETK